MTKTEAQSFAHELVAITLGSSERYSNLSWSRDFIPKKLRPKKRIWKNSWLVHIIIPERGVDIASVERMKVLEALYRAGMDIGLDLHMQLLLWIDGQKMSELIAKKMAKSRPYFDHIIPVGNFLVADPSTIQHCKRPRTGPTLPRHDFLNTPPYENPQLRDNT